MEAIVAKVLTNTKLVLNKGSNAGIGLGDQFLIFELSDEDIVDPISGKSLGKLEIVKGTGTATNVQEKITTIESTKKLGVPRKTSKNNTWTSKTIFGEYEQIEYENDDEKKPFEDVKIGDIARKIEKKDKINNYSF